MQGNELERNAKIIPQAKQNLFSIGKEWLLLVLIVFVVDFWFRDVIVEFRILMMVLLVQRSEF